MLMEDMRLILVVWMALIVAVGYAVEFRDVYGIVHNTDGKNVVIVLGNTNCAGMDNVIRFQLSGLIEDYPDVMALAVFPCTNSAPEAVKAWQARVPGASNFCPIELDARAVDPLLTHWQNMGYPQYAGFVFNGSGECVMEWPYWKARQSVEVPLTRELNSLRITRGSNGPVVSFRQTKIAWRMQTNHGPVKTYQLVYP